ncbi:hypothetical protein KIPB_008123 [Kipferlia bialata]|uniref:RING-type domain-containing protein n=1 Tax=Kipferlia bialata TaxID=797122 RepID=A0A9K3D029_9EUKA|nr:hypothetical protein KIPB_008123 [Kipferlia bialata]|eukprot:g8123.t1
MDYISGITDAIEDDRVRASYERKVDEYIRRRARYGILMAQGSQMIASSLSQREQCRMEQKEHRAHSLTSSSPETELERERERENMGREILERVGVDEALKGAVLLGRTDTEFAGVVTELVKLGEGLTYPALVGYLQSKLQSTESDAPKEGEAPGESGREADLHLVPRRAIALWVVDVYGSMLARISAQRDLVLRGGVDSTYSQSLSLDMSVDSDSEDTWAGAEGEGSLSDTEDQVRMGVGRIRSAFRYQRPVLSLSLSTSLSSTSHLAKERERHRQEEEAQREREAERERERQKEAAKLLVEFNSVLDALVAFIMETDELFVRPDSTTAAETPGKAMSKKDRVVIPAVYLLLRSRVYLQPECKGDQTQSDTDVISLVASRLNDPEVLVTRLLQLGDYTKAVESLPELVRVNKTDIVYSVAPELVAVPGLAGTVLRDLKSISHRDAFDTARLLPTLLVTSDTAPDDTLSFMASLLGRELELHKQDKKRMGADASPEAKKQAANRLSLFRTVADYFVTSCAAKIASGLEDKPRKPKQSDAVTTKTVSFAPDSLSALPDSTTGASAHISAKSSERETTLSQSSVSHSTVSGRGRRERGRGGRSRHGGEGARSARSAAECASMMSAPVGSDDEMGDWLDSYAPAVRRDVSALVRLLSDDVDRAPDTIFTPDHYLCTLARYQLWGILAHILERSGKLESAVLAALDAGHFHRARSIASNISDECTRRRAMRAVILGVAKRDSVARALTWAEKGKVPLLEVIDGIPSIAGSVEVRETICRSFTELHQQASLAESAAHEQMRATDAVKRDLSGGKRTQSKGTRLSPSTPCPLCREPLFGAPVVLYPCGHTIHRHCSQRLTSTARKDVLAECTLCGETHVQAVESVIGNERGDDLRAGGSWSWQTQFA